MKNKSLLTLSFAAFFALRCAADLKISHSDNYQSIGMALSVSADDVVIIRSKSGPIAVVRFLALGKDEVRFIWSFLGSGPLIQSSEKIEKVQLRPLPSQQRIREFPAASRTQIENGVAAEAQLTLGEIVVTIHTDIKGRFALDYYRENAELDLLPAKPTFPAQE